MTTPVQNMLFRMYKISETPYREEKGVPVPLKHYFDNEDLVPYLDWIKIDKSIILLSIPPEDIHSTILFILQLVNTPVDLEGSLRVKPSITYLVNSIFDELSISDQDSDRIAVEAIVEKWFDVLTNAPKEMIKLYKHKPLHERAPILTYHTESFESCKAAHPNYPLYRAYAYELHKRIRFNDRLGLDDDNHESYIRSARYFFVHTTMISKTRNNFPAFIPIAVISDFKKGYKDYRLGHRPSGKAIETAEAHVDRIHDLWHRRVVNPRPRFRKGVSQGSDELTLPKGSKVDPPIPEFKSDGYTIDDEHEEEDEWSGAEYNPDEDWNFTSIPAEETQETTEEDPEILNKYLIDHFHTRNFHMYWDKIHLGLFHYSMLYQGMQDILEKDPKALHRLLVVYFYLLIHTGINSKRLLDLRGSSEDPISESEAELIMIDDRYYLLNPTLIKLKTAPKPGLCLSTSKKTYIPVPAQIAALFPPDIIENKYVFSYLDGDKVKRLNSDAIFEFLADVNNSFKLYNPKITLPKIISSFQTLYQHRYGLDPIIACHISGKDHQRLYKTQMHYIHVPHETLAKAYLHTFNTVNLSIRQNLTQCIRSKLIQTDSKTAPQVVNEKLNVIQDDHTEGYGSPFIPLKGYINNLLGTLQTNINNEQDLINRHNLYTIYTYLGLQFATALRPRKNPDVPINRFNSRAGTILINDKVSEIYREERLVPLPPVILYVITELITGIKKMQEYIQRNLILSDQSDKAQNMFFFIDKSGRFIPFTVKGMLSRLAAIGVDYNLPPNMPRHYLRTYLYYLDISNDVADIWMGHQHLGRETMSIISSTVFADAVKICLPRIEKMMKHIGFFNIAYGVNNE